MNSAADQSPMPVPWKPDRTLKLILIWISVIFLIAWLPMIRGAFDGSTYEWRTEYFGQPFGGKGTNGDYWLPVMRSFLGIILLWLGWRGRLKAFSILAPPVLLFTFADALYSSYTEPDAYVFRGDTLGMEVSLAWVAPVLSALFLALTLRWSIRQSRRPEPTPPTWSRTNTIWLSLLVLLLPVQFLLLRSGSPGSTNDVVGVILTIAQWLLLGVALYPRTFK
jgi:hypothetical protein